MDMKEWQDLPNWFKILIQASQVVMQIITLF